MKLILFSPAYQEALVELILTIQQQEFGLPIGLEEQPDLLAIQEHYSQFWLALDEDQLVGSIALVDLGNHHAALKKMFVRSDYRQAGIGRLLVNHLVAKSKDLEIHSIYLGTTQEFKAAQHFYKKYGFQEIEKNQLPANFPLLKVDDTFYCYHL